MDSETRPTLSVLIPAYNEANTIREILRRVMASPVNKEILVVDDGSSDGTRAILEELQAVAPPAGNRLRVFHQHPNQGKTAAIRRAVPEASGKITIIQDADLEVNPMEYPSIIEPILQNRADVVYGSRFHGGARAVAGYRHYLGNKLLTTISNCCTNLHLTDMETCYKAFRTDILQSIPIRSSGFGFEPEITAKVARKRCRVFEVPISYESRTYADGKKIGFRDALYAVAMILKYRLFDDLSKP